jgi:hypothetical protein
MMPDQADEIISSMKMIIDRVEELNTRVCFSTEIQTRIDQKLIDHIDNHKWYEELQENVCKSRHLSMAFKIIVPIIMLLIALTGYFTDRWMTKQENADKELRKGVRNESTYKRPNYHQSVRAEDESSGESSGY